MNQFQILVILSSFLSISIYLCGFLQIKYSLSNKSCPLNTIAHKTKKTKIILFIIDALRFDYFFPDDADSKLFYHNNFPLLNQIYQQSSDGQILFHKFLADPPTTTGQRIKALTSGTIPTFFELKNSFNTETMIEDNLLYQLSSIGKRIIFLGDDTWLSLYSNETFYESYPFPSFIVKDLHTVDDGIIKHIFSFLPNTDDNDKNNCTDNNNFANITFHEGKGVLDWDLLIAHFLGVDHCGHWLGINHPAMRQKLRQMDSLLHEIIRKLDNDTILLVFGDHGATSSGDHGGESKLEIESFLYAYSNMPRFMTQPKFMNSQDSRIPSIWQIDLVPTISALFSIPIPFSNFGRIIPDFLLTLPSTFNNSLTDAKMTDKLYHFVLENWNQVEQIWQLQGLETKLDSVEKLELNRNRHALKNMSELIFNFHHLNDLTNLTDYQNKFINLALEHIANIQRLARKYWVSFYYPFMYIGLIGLCFAFMAYTLKYLHCLLFNSKFNSYRRTFGRENSFFPIIFIPILITLVLTLKLFPSWSFAVFTLVVLNFICIYLLSKYILIMLKQLTSLRCIPPSTGKNNDIFTEEFQPDFDNEILKYGPKNDYLHYYSNAKNGLDGKTFFIPIILLLILCSTPSIALFSNSYIEREDCMSKFVIVSLTIGLAIISIYPSLMIFDKNLPLQNVKFCSKTQRFFPFSLFKQWLKKRQDVRKIILITLALCLCIRFSLYTGPAVGQKQNMQSAKNLSVRIPPKIGDWITFKSNLDLIYNQWSKIESKLNSYELKLHLWSARCRSQALEAGTCVKNSNSDEIIKHFNNNTNFNYTILVFVAIRHIVAVIISISLPSWWMIVKLFENNTTFCKTRLILTVSCLCLIYNLGTDDIVMTHSFVSKYAFTSLFIYLTLYVLQRLVILISVCMIGTALISKILDIFQKLCGFKCCNTLVVNNKRKDILNVTICFAIYLHLLWLMGPIFTEQWLQYVFYTFVLCAYVYYIQTILPLMLQNNSNTNICAFYIVIGALWLSLGNWGFFLTQHQTEISAIPWRIAFTNILTESEISKKYHLNDHTILTNLFDKNITFSHVKRLLGPFGEPWKVVSAYNIVSHTFSAHIMSLIGVYIPVRNALPNMKSHINNSILYFMLCKILMCTVCVFVQRRHLMLWAIFFPRFIYALWEYVILSLLYLTFS